MQAAAIHGGEKDHLRAAGDQPLDDVPEVQVIADGAADTAKISLEDRRLHARGDAHIQLADRRMDLVIDAGHLTAPVQEHRGVVRAVAAPLDDGTDHPHPVPPRHRANGFGRGPRHRLRAGEPVRVAAAQPGKRLRKAGNIRTIDGGLLQ